MWLSTPLGILVDSPPPVIVQAFTESLCIDCKHFFINSLMPAYNQLGAVVIDLQLVPFGNAKLDMKSKSVECQHGPAECDANTWQQCAVRQTNASTHIKFFECLENTLPMGHKDEPCDEQVFAKCATQSGIDFEGLKRCHGNPVLRWMLQKENSDKTPGHQYVPWVYINGNLFNYETDDFLSTVCKEYAANGGSHPACSSGIEQATLSLDRLQTDSNQLPKKSHDH